MVEARLVEVPDNRNPADFALYLRPPYGQPSSMETHLVIAAFGSDRPGLAEAVSRAIVDSGCEFGDSRMTVLGGEFAMVLEATGNWSAVAKLETALPRVASSNGLTIQSTRSEPRSSEALLVPYAVEVIAVNRAGVVSDVTAFFSGRNINIEDLYTSRYCAPHTNTPMFALHLTVGIPSDLSIAMVRGEFMDFCDELNLDAMLAPVK